MKNRLFYRINSDNGFMGNTHALSVVAVVLSIAAFMPTIFFTKLLGSKDLFVLITAVIIAVGAGLMPDLDNTRSSAISTMGIIGQGLSAIMRAFSEAIYTFTHTSKEPSESDPHRGYWHTALSGILAGIIIIFLMKLDTPFMTIGKHIFSIATFILFIMIVLGFELAITGLLGQQLRSIKDNTTGKLVLWITGIVIAVILLTLMPSLHSYKWVGYMVIIGWCTHILGDTLTTSGTPILFPLTHNGKRWWSYRLPPHIHANGSIEKMVFLPGFAVIVIIAIVKLVSMGIINL